MNDILFVFGLAGFFAILSMFKHRDEVISEQFKEDMKVDHLQTCNMLLYVNRNDAERHIDAFYGRWSGKVDEWELSTRTASLYKRLFEIQKTRAQIDPFNK
jgi:hypothetical protein